jgi:succinyl-CoA synthetase beta subunit
VHRAEQILGMSIKEMPVKKVLVEEFRQTEKELYLGITIDRKLRRPVIIASIEGGMDIEEIARQHPEKIFRAHLNPLTGIHDYQARNISYFLDRKNSVLIANIVKKLYQVFTDCDCTLAEINPLGITPEGLFALDAKITIDDSALFRQEFKEEEQGSLSGIARKHGMSYVDLEGDTGCIVNGAGLAMATLDLIKEYGGEPANFMDVRAGATAEQIRTALKLVSLNRNVNVILINIFGGLTRCDEVARGIIQTLSEIKMPLVVRLAGTNEKTGRDMLKKEGITLALSTEEAAKMVVELGHSRG